MYRYNFNFDSDLTTVTTTQVFKSMPKFDGKKFSVTATPKEIIVACGDCTIPAVYFFDNDMD